MQADRSGGDDRCGDRRRVFVLARVVIGAVEQNSRAGDRAWSEHFGRAQPAARRRVRLDRETAAELVAVGRQVIEEYSISGCAMPGHDVGRS